MTENTVNTQPAEFVGTVAIEPRGHLVINGVVTPVGVIRVGNAVVPFQAEGRAAVYVRKYADGIAAEVVIARYDGPTV